MTEEEIITAIHITPGNEDDGKQHKRLSDRVAVLVRRIISTKSKN